MYILIPWKLKQFQYASHLPMQNQVVCTSVFQSCRMMFTQKQCISLELDASWSIPREFQTIRCLSDCSIRPLFGQGLPCEVRTENLSWNKIMASWSIALHQPNFCPQNKPKLDARVVDCEKYTLIFLLKFLCVLFCWNLCSNCLRSSRVNLPTLLVSPYIGDRFPPPTCVTVDLCTKDHHQMATKIREDSINLCLQIVVSE
jgi:hypothetical protein